MVTLNDILMTLRHRQWFIDHEKRRRYMTGGYDTRPIITALDKELAKELRLYERETGRHIPKWLLRRYVDA